MKNKLLLSLLLMLTRTEVLGQSTISLHPGNPHYFVWKGKPTVLITSGEHYGAVMNLDFDYVTYLTTLRRDGLNLTRLFTGGYVEPKGAFGITSNTMAPAPNRYLCPWARSAVPGYANGGNKFDLTRWDEAYFTRLKDFVGQAERRGIVVELALFCPFYEDIQWNISPFKAENNVNGFGRVKGHAVHTLDQHGGLLATQEAMVRKIVTELNGFDNVLFEICNEPYFGGVTMPWQHHIADLIVETERSLPNRHLITQNIANGAAKITKPHPAVSVFNFHYATPPKAVALNYELGKVLGDNETGFRGRADSTYRKEGWEYLLAGGALYNNLDYSFTVDAPTGTAPLGPKEPGGGSPALRRQLSTLRDFMRSFDFVNTKPDSALLAVPLPARVRLHALSDGATQWALYIYKGTSPAPAQPLSLALNLSNGRYRLVWTDPETGQKTRQKIDHPGGVVRIDTPPFALDLALTINKP